MYSIIRPLLFSLEAERAHALALSTLAYTPSCCFKHPRGKAIKAMGLDFPHAVGLAAGLDKNGEYLDALAKIGFSFIELGTVTPRPQAGNPKPRLFRLPQTNALINRMGFNNQGVEALVAHIKKAKYRGILGVNIGKNKETSLNQAAEDYLICFRLVYEYASYVTINISSPNTLDLRLLQQKECLDHLLLQLSTEQKKLSHQFQRHVPLVVKVSPDEEEETLKQMTDLLLDHGIEGIIATNTTLSREGIKDIPGAQEQGGLSGRPLRDLSNRCLRLLKQYTGNALTLIGSGGIDTACSAQEKLDCGASLVQLYSGLIYQGPQLVSDLVSSLNSKTIPVSLS